MVSCNNKLVLLCCVMTVSVLVAAAAANPQRQTARSGSPAQVLNQNKVGYYIYALHHWNLLGSEMRSIL